MQAAEVEAAMSYKLFAVIALACLFGCKAGGPGAKATPTPTPSLLSKAEQIAIDEIVGHDASDNSTERATARRVAAEFASKLLPSWQVRGIHSQLIGKQFYRVLVDVEKGKRRETLDLTAVRFYLEDAAPYWKVRPTTLNTNHALRESDEIDKIKELNRLKAELEEEKSRDDGPDDLRPPGDPRN